MVQTLTGILGEYLPGGCRFRVFHDCGIIADPGVSNKKKASSTQKGLEARKSSRHAQKAAGDGDFEGFCEPGIGFEHNGLTTGSCGQLLPRDLFPSIPQIAPDMSIANLAPCHMLRAFPNPISLIGENIGDEGFAPNSIIGTSSFPDKIERAQEIHDGIRAKNGGILKILEKLSKTCLNIRRYVENVFNTSETRGLQGTHGGMHGIPF